MRLGVNMQKQRAVSNCKFTTKRIMMCVYDGFCGKVFVGIETEFCKNSVKNTIN